MPEVCPDSKAFNSRTEICMRVSIQIAITSLVVCSAILIVAAGQATLTTGILVTRAPAGFDNATNGVVSQTVFDADRSVFEEKESIEDGLGPVYNATGCADCHGNPVVGGSSQVTELRAGHWDPNTAQFRDPPGGSLIQD